MKPLLCLAVLLVPTFAIGNDCRVVQRQRVVRYTYPVVYPYTYSVGAAIQEQAVAERIAQRVEQLLAEREELGRRRRRDQPQEPPVTEPQEPAEPDSPVQALFDARCLKCHQGPEAEAGLDLSDARMLTRCEARSVYYETNLGHMPKKADPLTDAEMLLITEWIENRKPNEGE